MSGRPEDEDSDEKWQARTHILRENPLARPKPSGGDCLVIIYSRNTNQLGRRFMLDPSAPECSVGRGSDNAVVLDSDAVSRRHARFTRQGMEWAVSDNNSTNGTFVNDELVQSTVLRRGDHIKIGDTIFKFLAGSDVEAEFIQTIGTIMVTDGLTQAHNRRHLVEQIEKELLRARRHERPLALVMFDIDHFKNVNDSWGHLAGDYVLRELASVIRTRIRRDEVFARYGGEEFAILLPETELSGAVTLGEDLRGEVASHRFEFDGHIMPITMSVGVALAEPQMRTAEEFIKVTDEKLYEAKRGGRNRVAH